MPCQSTVKRTNGEPFLAARYLNMTDGLQRDERVGSSVVPLHEQSIKAWHSMLDIGLNGMDQLLVTDTPGVGKSMTSLLMQQDKTVFYEARTAKALRFCSACT